MFLKIHVENGKRYLWKDGAIINIADLGGRRGGGGSIVDVLPLVD